MHACAHQADQQSLCDTNMHTYRILIGNWHVKEMQEGLIFSSKELYVHNT
jgi:hypothetical protein